MTRSTMAAYMHVDGWDGFDRNLDFDKKEVRKGMQRAGREVQKEARKLVGRKARSRRAEYPGRDTGTLARSVRYKVSRSGFLVRVAPQKTGAMKDYYPAYLHYGVRAGAVRRRNHRAQGSTGGWRIAPRKNFMADALQNRRGRVTAILRRAFAASLQ